MLEAVLIAARLVLAAVLALAAAGKLLDREGSRQAARELGAPARLAAPVATVLPAVELALAGALVSGRFAVAGAVGAAALLAVFSGAIAVSLVRGRRPDCHCFGRLHSAPAGPVTLARNGALAAAAIAVAAIGWGEPGSSALAWLGGVGGGGATVLLALAVALAAAVAYLRLLRRHGVVLLRLDRLEEAAARAGVDVDAALAELEPQLGLPLGAPAPSLRLPRLGGGEVAIAEQPVAEARPLLLLFASPGCLPCAALLPRVPGWQREHQDTMTIAVVGLASADALRAELDHDGLDLVLVDADGAAYEAFGAPGTPSAVLIRADGSVDSAAATGADGVEQLVREAGAQLERPHPGPAPGDEAPELSLPQLSGEPLRLADLRGRELLLLFWNPDCGFCRAMLDELRAWETARPAGAPELVVISAGDAEAVRREGWRSTVLLDPALVAGPLFGATGTPMALRLDAAGRVASPLVAGRQAVMDLAGRDESPLVVTA